MTEIRTYTDIELLALPSIVVNPGTTDANGITRNREESNPFKVAVTAGVPGAWDLACRWGELHGWHGRPDVASDFTLDPFSSIRDVLGGGQRLFHEVRNEAGELTGAHPITATDVAEWERSLAAMTAAQVTEIPAPKPLDPGPTRGRNRIVRGD